MDDPKIVDLFLQRDEAAIFHAREKYGRRLRRLAYGIVQDTQAAEGCENDTYLAAWNAIPPHTPSAYLYAFLARITRRIALNCCRDRKRLKRSAHICTLSAEMAQCIPGADDVEIDAVLLKDAINRFLAGLDAEKRNIFVRRYWYLDSIADIAHRFSLSESKVKTTLFRCRRQLRTQLEREGYTV